MSLRRIVLFGLFTVVVFAAAPSGCGSAEPVVLPPEDCTVPGDEDESGLADCDDPTCWQPGVCEEVCDSGWDEDGDGEVACGDSDCWIEGGTCVERCDTENDEDGDGDVSCADDECWVEGGGCSEVCELEGDYDEDADGAADCADDDCWVEGGVCLEVCTGFDDEDGDRLVDCEDPDCELDIACAPTYWGEVRAIFMERCDDCHTVNDNGELNFLDYADILEPSYFCRGMSKGECALSRIIDGSMPSDCPFCVPDEEIETLEAWIQAGLPEGNP